MKKKTALSMNWFDPIARKNADGLSLHMPAASSSVNNPTSRKVSKKKIKLQPPSQTATSAAGTFEHSAENYNNNPAR